MRRLEVRLLGEFAVLVDSRAVPPDAWPQRRAADLVKVLALAPGHRLARDEVLEALWPQLGADAAAGGYCAILAMPNTDPVVDSAAVLGALVERARAEACLPVGFFGTITRGQAGAEL